LYTGGRTADHATRISRLSSPTRAVLSHTARFFLETSLGEAAKASPSVSKTCSTRCILPKSGVKVSTKPAA
jgi:hypothetical protein